MRLDSIAPQRPGQHRRVERSAAQLGQIVVERSPGLMWQTSDDNLGHPYEWAVDNAGGQRTSGFHDWRIPTCQELMSLRDNNTGTTIQVSE